MERIVYVIGQLGVGGTEKQLLHLVQRLDRTRWKPSVICLSDEHPMAADFENSDCLVHVISRSRIGKAAALRSLKSTLVEIKPAILQAFAYAWYLAIPAAWFAGVRKVVVAERTIPPWKTTAHIWTDRFMLPRTSRAIVNSQRVCDDLVNVHGMPRDRCRVVYNGIDLKEFDALAMAADGGSSRPQTPVICALANAKEDKRLDVLIDSFAIVKARIPEAKLWIIGDGPLRKSLEDRSMRLGLERDIRFWGNRSDHPSLLRQATIGVNSSRVEGLCNAILEYMAAGLPVVATDVGGNAELVTHERTGLLVKQGDAALLAEALVTLSQNREMARSLGSQGRLRVEQDFRVERMVSETERVYEELRQMNGRHS